MRLSERVVENMIKQGVLPEENREIYVFGMIQMLRSVINIFTSIFVGCLFGMPAESLVFIIYTVLIRSYSGGYHSESPWICYLVSVGVIIVVLYSIKMSMWNLPTLIAGKIASIAVLLRYSPLEHKNKPLDEVEKKIYRKRLFLILSLLSIVNFCFKVCNKSFLLYSGTGAFIMSALMVLAGKI